MNAIEIAKKFPIGIRNCMSPFVPLFPNSWRFGPCFEDTNNEVNNVFKMNESEVVAEKNRRIHEIVCYAYDHVQYYRELFDKNHINARSIYTEKDLAVVPFLTKEMLSENLDKLISDEYKKADLVYASTSGTTGTPTVFFLEKCSQVRDEIYVRHFFDWLGYGFKSTRVVLRGREFVPQNKKVHWQWDALKGELSINIFLNDDKNMEQYCKIIEKIKPQFAYGYPSAMYALCKYIQLRGGLNHQFRGFIAISESLYKEQRDFISKIINAPAVSFYGMSEKVIIAGQRGEQSGYIVEPLYGVAELVRADGTVINSPGETGEIVGTGLYNYGMPLIRYKMGDMASWDNDIIINGVTKKVFKSVEGRLKKDVLINRRREIVSMASLCIHSHIHDWIQRYQFYQDLEGVAVIKILPNKRSGLTNEMIDEIENAFTNRTERLINFHVQVVDDIPPNKNGKFSLVDQRLSVEEYLYGERLLK